MHVHNVQVFGTYLFLFLSRKRCFYIRDIERTLSFITLIFSVLNSRSPNGAQSYKTSWSLFSIHYVNRFGKIKEIHVNKRSHESDDETHCNYAFLSYDSEWAAQTALNEAKTGIYVDDVIVLILHD